MAENGFKSRNTPRVLVGYDAAVTQWVSNHLSCRFGECSALGFVLDGQIIAGVVYSNYTGHDIHLNIASIDKRWCNRTSLRNIFAYPFLHLKCRRATVLVDEKAILVQKFVERIGFKKEGLLREGHPNDNAVVFGMLKSECRWINGKEKRAKAS